MLKLSLFGGVPVPLNANELLWGLTVNISAYSEDISTVSLVPEKRRPLSIRPLESVDGLF